MTLLDRQDFTRLVDPDKGTVDRRIFHDREIYQIELERIFARAWNFMCHDSQIPNPGDLFMTFIGEDRVIVVRDNDGLPQVLINSCRHRGNAVCRAEEGHATSFMCTYHGWTYDLKGALVGVPGFKEVYHEELDRENWGLIKAGKVDTFKGFVFATMDAAAPDLDEFLGEVGQIGLSLLAERGDEMKAVAGVQKYTMQCNWKFAVDNLFDWYHPMLSHASAIQVGVLGPPKRGGGQPGPNPWTQANLVMLGEYGHATAGPLSYENPDGEKVEIPGFDETWRERPGAVQSIPSGVIKTQTHPNIFPNLWVSHNSNQLSLRHPKGPGATEIWWFTFLDKEQPEQNYAMKRFMANHIFGPAGLLEMDDGENWGESTKGTRGTVSGRYPLNYAMTNKQDRVINDEAGPPRIETRINEHAQLWTYRAWADWMSAESWDDLRARHADVPRDIV
jgi:phenylpropionate dioxygenase-like ring-hydroxylating dioxygenase large terminal subunit